MQLGAFGAAELLLVCCCCCLAAEAAGLEKLQFAGCDQSSTRRRSNGSSSLAMSCNLAIDRSISRDALASPGCAMTQVESHAEWFGYLPRSVQLHSVVLWSRKRPAAGHQSTDVWVDTFDGQKWRRCGSVLDRYKFTAVRCRGRGVRILRVRRMRRGALTLCEVEAFGQNSRLLGRKSRLLGSVGGFAGKRCPPGYSKRGGKHMSKRRSKRSSEDDDAGSSGRCRRCSPGTFSNQWGSGSCRKCPPGTFAAGRGHSSCSRCPPGTEAKGRGSTRCRRCPGGTFARNSGTARCRRCPAGTRAAGTGATACAPCSRGTFSTRAQASCTTCPAPVPHKLSPACYKRLQFSRCYQSGGDYNYGNYQYGACNKAMDGVYERYNRQPYCAHSGSSSTYYWEAYFPAPVNVTHIAVWSYYSTSYSYNVQVQVYDKNNKWHTCAVLGSSYTVKVISCNVPHATIVRILRYSKSYLALCEVEAYTYGHGRG